MTSAPIPINIAIEDLLSEAVARRLLEESGRPFEIGVAYNRGGIGYLKKTAPGWNQAAKGVPFFLLTDLDAAPCASELIGSWVPGSLHPNLIFRVAIRETESWLLADSPNLSRFLRVSPTLFPPMPETLSDPKAVLVSLARRSRLGPIKASIVPRPDSTAKQGRDYNACLTEFVRTQWNPSEAAVRSESLRRCMMRLASFAPAW